MINIQQIIGLRDCYCGCVNNLSVLWKHYIIRLEDSEHPTWTNIRLLVGQEPELHYSTPADFNINEYEKVSFSVNISGGFIAPNRFPLFSDCFEDIVYKITGPFIINVDADILSNCLAKYNKYDFATYCSECGGRTAANTEFCWACEHGI